MWLDHKVLEQTTSSRYITVLCNPEVTKFINVGVVVCVFDMGGGQCLVHSSLSQRDHFERRGVYEWWWQCCVLSVKLMGVPTRCALLSELLLLLLPRVCMAAVSILPSPKQCLRTEALPYLPLFFWKRTPFTDSPFSETKEKWFGVILYS